MFKNIFAKKEQTEGTASKKKGKKWIVIIGVVAIVGIIVGLGMTKGKEVGIPVSVAQALKGDIMQTVDVSGTVSSEKTKVYFAQVTAPAMVSDLCVGQMIQKGDMVISYDTTDIENSIKQAQLEGQISKTGAQASITGIVASEQKVLEAAKNYEEAEKYVQHYTECVNSAKAQLSEADELLAQQQSIATEIADLTKKAKEKPDSEKIQKQLKEKNKALKEVEKQLKQYNLKEIKEALEICSADLADYKAQLEQYKVQKEAADPAAGLMKQQQGLIKESADLSMELAQDDLEKAQAGVIADFDGIVTAVNVVDGQTVSQGMELFSVDDVKNIKVSLSISKYDIDKVKIGQNATVIINGHEYEGAVSKVSRVASTNENGGTVVKTEVHIKNPDDAIVLGVEGKVKIETAQETGALLIPSSCINYATEGVFCYAVVDGKVKKVPIETGISDDEFTQIISGLKEGDQIIKDIVTEMEEGQMVTVIEDAAENMAEDSTEK